MSTQPPAITASNPPRETALTTLANLDERTEVEDLARVLVVLQDFLIHADDYLLDELAAYAMVRPENPQDCVRCFAWVQASRLRNDERTPPGA